MNDSKKPPIVFANQVIRMLVDHSLGADKVVSSSDYLVIRMTFRFIGGSWSGFQEGNLLDVELIKATVNAWGKLSLVKSMGT